METAREEWRWKGESGGWGGVEIGVKDGKGRAGGDGKAMDRP